MTAARRAGPGTATVPAAPSVPPVPDAPAVPAAPATPFLALTPLLPPAAVQSAMADAALIFLVGGLAVLAGVAVLVFLQNLIPQRRARRAAAPERELRPVGGAPTDMEVEFQPKRNRLLRTVRSIRPDVKRPRIDYAMDRIVRAGIGEPRILRSVGSYTRARLYGCRTCARSPGGCHAERAGIEEAFRVVYSANARVREVACRARGSPECEFEVRH